MSGNGKKSCLAVIHGDPGGIGPELIAKLLSRAETAQAADILLVGDRHVFEQGQKQAGVSYELAQVDERIPPGMRDDAYPWLPMETIEPAEVRIAEVTEANGRSALRNLDRALGLARDGIVDGILFGPFNKAALHAAGLGFDDELHYMANWLGSDSYISEINVLGRLFTSRVTSHVPVKDVVPLIRAERIVEAVQLAHDTVKRAGVERPRIAVAALNPHAGDGGNIGREEIEIIAPAVKEAAGRGIAVDGPWPADTVFLRAKDGRLDAIVTMYHDQGQIAMKLMGFDRGVTVQGGLPIPVTTPAHGTAFDIAGRGVADVSATVEAFNLLCRMTAWSHAEPSVRSRAS